jgi:hypothetical protein
MVSEGSTQRLYASREEFIILVYKCHGARGRDHLPGDARADAGAPVNQSVANLRLVGGISAHERQPSTRGGQKHGISAMESRAKSHADA